MRFFPFQMLLYVFLFAGLAAPLTAGERTLELTPCARNVGVAGAQCGTMEVLEDRSATEGHRIKLKVVLLPSLGREPKPDPLFLLAGGPGMPASELADFAELHLRRIRQSREIVLVDQRGTGELSPLQCDDINSGSTYYNFEEEFPYKILRDCLAGFDADPRHYTTPVAMDDLDDVRAALGYEQINLWGGSYGTRAALIYLRRHPNRTRAVILDGVAPTAIRLPLHLGEDANRALELMLADCEADADCSSSFPKVRQNFRELLDRLRDEPQHVSGPHPRTGRMLDFDMSRKSAVFLFRAALYSDQMTRLLPLMIKRAHAGDYGPILALADSIGEAAKKMNLPMLFSVLCAEDIGTISKEDREKLAMEPLLGTAVLDMWEKVCSFWPLGELPDHYHDPVVSNRPVLVLSGEFDPVTPPRWGEAAAQHLSNSLHVVVPGAAHGTSSYGCLPRLMASFLNDAGIDDLDTNCVEDLKRPMFFESFAGPRVGAAPNEGEAP